MWAHRGATFQGRLPLLLDFIRGAIVPRSWAPIVWITSPPALPLGAGTSPCAAREGLGARTSSSSTSSWTSPASSVASSAWHSFCFSSSAATSSASYAERSRRSSRRRPLLSGQEVEERTSIEGTRPRLARGGCGPRPKAPPIQRATAVGKRLTRRSRRRRRWRERRVVRGGELPGSARYHFAMSHSMLGADTSQSGSV